MLADAISPQAVLSAIIGSLRLMWRKLTAPAGANTMPMLEVGVILSVPNLIITPSLDVIKQTIIRIVQEVSLVFTQELNSNAQTFSEPTMQ